MYEIHWSTVTYGAPKLFHITQCELQKYHSLLRKTNIAFSFAVSKNLFRVQEPLYLMFATMICFMLSEILRLLQCTNRVGGFAQL